MRHTIEMFVAWGAVLIGVIVCLFVGWLLVQEVRRGLRSRFGATVIYALASPIMGAVPIVIALGARWLGVVGGFALFSANGSNDGNLTGVGFMGFVIAFGATVLFAAVMLVQALIRSGGSYDGRQGMRLRPTRRPTTASTRTGNSAALHCQTVMRSVENITTNSTTNKAVFVTAKGTISVF